MLTRSEKLNELVELSRNTEDLKEFVKTFDNDASMFCTTPYSIPHPSDSMEF